MKNKVKVLLMFLLLFTIEKSVVLADVVALSVPDEVVKIGGIFLILMLAICAIVLLCFGLLNLKEKKEKTIVANKEKLK